MSDEHTSTRGQGRFADTDMTIAEAERITWRCLDKPTIAYVRELVREVAGDEVYLKLVQRLDDLERHGGYIPEHPGERLQ